MTMADGTPGAQRGGMGRWLGIALIASLCVNLLVAGAVASSFWSLRHHGGERGVDGLSPGGFRRFVETLPPERRAQIRGSAEGMRRTLAPLRQQARAAREEVQQLLVAPTVDKEKLIAAHQREIEAEGAIRKTVSGALVDLVSAMTPEERRRLAEWREARHAGRAMKRAPARHDDLSPK